LFGLGRDERSEWIEVTWPNGRAEKFAGEARAGTTLSLREGTGRVETLALARGAQLPDPLTRAETFARGLRIKVGHPMPELALNMPGRAATTLQRQLQPGRRTLVNVWATWCAPCAAEMPELEKLRLPLAARGIDLIGLNVDSDPAADVRGFIREKRVGYPNFLGGVRAIESLYATDELSVPMSIIVDERGIVAEIIPGWSAETQKRFRALAGEGGAAGMKTKSNADRR